MALIVFDTFTGANGTDIAAHAPDTDVVGGGWKQAAANSVELDGSGALKFASSNDNCRIDTGTADQIITANFNAGGIDNRISVLARSDDADFATATLYLFNFRPAAGGTNAFIQKRIAGGAAVTIAAAAVTLSGSTTYEIEFSVIGSTLEVRIDGSLEVSGTDTEITAGDYSGLIHNLYTDSAARFFDFQVDDVSGVQTIAPTFITSDELFYAPTVVRLLDIISPVFIPTQETFYNPDVVPLSVLLSPEFIPSEETVYSPDVQLLLQQLLPDFIASQEAFYRATVLGGDKTVIPLASRYTWNAVAQYLRTLVFSGQDNDVIQRWLISEGYEDAYNDNWQNYLEGEGYLTGSLADRYAKWRIGANGTDPWILAEGTWDDTNIWRDTEIWRDS